MDSVSLEWGSVWNLNVMGANGGLQGFRNPVVGDRKNDG
jgi:hypothetical protein